ncbi:MAG: hypothetical protein L3J05_07700 [Robiginitomaculum sp.]|nr:hypothetical protein [Robiginitomaculum sp.]MCF6275632.1 hypothetical protein [Robiginitomaculum sp.]
MKFTTKLSLFTVTGLLVVGCATVDPYSESSAVKRLVANEGQLAQNVDPDFLGEAYDQDGKAVVCKRVKHTGSRIGQNTVCRTQAQWDDLADEAHRKTQRMIDGGASSGDKT